MMRWGARFPVHATTRIALAALMVFFSASHALAGDLEEIKARGVLRHLGAPYANFVTGSGDGLDVEMLKLFAEHLGVKYEYVKTTWREVLQDLSGKQFKREQDEIKVLGSAPVRGDIAANGLTILPWRKKLVDFSVATFPNQVWAVTNEDAPLTPVTPSGDLRKDINAVKAQLRGKVVLCMSDTGVDPQFYRLEEAGAEVKCFRGTLNEMVPAIMNREGDVSLQDVSSVLVAVDKWPGKIKILGPISFVQNMGYAFSKDAPQLRSAFNQFFEQCKKDGTYSRIVRKYYPAIFEFYPDFFK